MENLTYKPEFRIAFQTLSELATLASRKAVLAATPRSLPLPDAWMNVPLPLSVSHYAVFLIHLALCSLTRPAWLLWASKFNGHHSEGQASMVTTVKDKHLAAFPQKILLKR